MKALLSGLWSIILFAVAYVAVIGGVGIALMLLGYLLTGNI